MGEDGGPEVEGVVDEVEVGGGGRVDGGGDEGEDEGVEAEGGMFGGGDEGGEDGEDGLFQEVFGAGLGPEGGEEGDDEVGKGGDLFLGVSMVGMIGWWEWGC